MSNNLKRFHFALLGSGGGPTTPPVAESFASNNVPNGGNLTITKPTGLAVGDLMFFWGAYYNISVDDNIGQPGGWTEVVNTINTNLQYAIMWKKADAGDVAASDFTFTAPTEASGVDSAAGGIYRISGADTTTPIHLSDFATSTTTPLNAPDITTTIKNTLILRLSAAGETGVGSFSTLEINATTPDWDDWGNDSQDTAAWAVAAQQAAAGATGTASCDANDTLSIQIAYTVAIKPG